jgi:hypothetical protein
MPEFGCQESQSVACWITPRHAGLRVLGEHTDTTAGRPLYLRQAKFATSKPRIIFSEREPEFDDSDEAILLALSK